MENKPQYLIIEDIIKSKNPALLKILPAFVLRYIKKTLHQNEMNAIIKRNYKQKKNSSTIWIWGT